MRALVIMKEMDVPVVFDATHSVQLPGGLALHPADRGSMCTARLRSGGGGDRCAVPGNSSAPGKALSDGPNSLHFKTAQDVVKKIKGLHEFKTKSL